MRSSVGAAAPGLPVAPRRRSVWAMAALLVIGGLALQLYRLGTVSLWADEVFSAELVRQPWRVFGSYLWGKQSSMAFYYFFLRAWMYVGSGLHVQPTELVVRLPSIGFAGLSVGVVFLLGRRFWGASVGLVGASLYGLNYLVLSEAGQARAYGMELFLVGISWYALLGAIDSGGRSRRHWLSYVAATVLMGYTHLFSVLVIASQGLAFLALLTVPTGWRPRARAAALPAAICAAAISILLLPILADAAIHGENNAWVPAATPNGLFHVVSSLSGHSPVYAVALALAVGVGLLAHLVRRQGWAASLLSAPPRESGGAGLALLAWVAGPVLLSYIASLPSHNLHLFFDRYLVVVVPAVALLAALGLSHLKPRLLQVGAAVALVALAAGAVPRFYGEAPRQDFRDTYGWIQDQYRSGDGLVCASIACSLAADYYSRAHPGPARFGNDYPGERAWTGGYARPIDPATLAIYGEQHPRVFFVTATTSLDFSLAKDDEAATRQWFDARYRLVSVMTWPGTFGPVSARLYSTGSN